MANDPPFATLNQFVADLGIPESQALRGLVLAVIAATPTSKTITSIGMATQSEHSIMTFYLG
jgi:hypothetical protein